jgi:hypothetical protein
MSAHLHPSAVAVNVAVVNAVKPPEARTAWPLEGGRPPKKKVAVAALFRGKYYTPSSMSLSAMMGTSPSTYPKAPALFAQDHSNDQRGGLHLLF